MMHMDLWIDCQLRRLVDKDGGLYNELPVFVRGDDILLRLRFVDVDRSVSPPTVAVRAFSAGATLNFTGKKTFDGAALVFAPWLSAWNQAGDWSGTDGVDVTKGRFSCRVNFASSDLLTAIAAADTLPMYYDIDVVDADGFNATLLKLKNVPLENDVRRGDENVPEELITYPTDEEFDNRVAPQLRWAYEDGGARLYINGTPGPLIR